MTPDQLKSAIARGKTDPIVFAEELLGMSLHKGQQRYLLIACLAVRDIVDLLNQGKLPQLRQKILDTLNKDQIERVLDGNNFRLIRRFVLSSSNRWGKSALISIIQLWYLFYKHGVRAANEVDHFQIEYRTANIAPFASLTEPVFKAMKQIMTSTYPVRGEGGITSTNKCQIEWFFLEDRTLNTPPFKLFFINNSYIEHLSLMGNKGDSLQGKPYGIITYDEAARSDHLQLEIDDAITGRLLDWTAPLHLLSTPAQDSASLLYYNDLYKEGLVGVNSSYTQTGSIYENTFFTPEQIAEQERMLEGNPLKRQVLHGEFIFGTQTLFPGQDILDAQDESLNDGILHQPEHRYVIGVDTAIGHDEMVYTVLDVTEKPYKLVWQEANKGSSKSPQLHLNNFINLVDSYRRDNNVQIIIETFNGESAYFVESLPPYIRAITQTLGTWQPHKQRSENSNPLPNRTAAIKKADILVSLKKILADKQLKIPKYEKTLPGSYGLIQQLTIYKEADKKLPTDKVIALALAVWLAEFNSKVLEPVWQSMEI